MRFDFDKLLASSLLVFFFVLLGARIAMAAEFETDPDTGEIIYSPDEGYSVDESSGIFGEVVEDVPAETVLSDEAADPDQVSLQESDQEAESESSADPETDSQDSMLDPGNFLGYAYLISDSADSDETEEFAVAAYSLSGISIPESGVISYDVTISGGNYILVFPVAYQDNLQVIDGYLYNVGTGSITGRLFSGPWSSSDYNLFFYTLAPVLASSYANTAYTYGESGYVTSYSYSSSSGRLVSSSFYAACQVNEELTGMSIKFNLGGLYLVFVMLVILCFLVFFLGMFRGGSNG